MSAHDCSPGFNDQLLGVCNRVTTIKSIALQYINYIPTFKPIYTVIAQMSAHKIIILYECMRECMRIYASVGTLIIMNLHVCVRVYMRVSVRVFECLLDGV